MYKELTNVATGVKGQLDACISALDLHEDPPQELEQLTTLLESAIQLCDTIVSKGEDEPDEPNKATTDAGGTSEVDAATEAVAPEPTAKDAGQEEAQKLEKASNIFEDESS